MTDQQDDTDNGWAWFDGAQSNADEFGQATEIPDTVRELRLSYARCFASADGEKVLNHLRSLTMERALGPGASAQMLRHMEGQRQLVSYIQAQFERGRLGG